MTTDAGAYVAAQHAARRRVRSLLWAALVVRVTVAVAIHFLAEPQLFAPDQQTYDAGGRYLAAVWSAGIPVSPDQVLPNGPRGYFYIVGAIYYLLGANDLLPKLLNCLIGALTIPVVYDLALRMGAGQAASLRAATYATWFPSLVLWSALNIRDPWIILLILLICRAALAVQNRPTVTGLLVLAGGTLALIQFRAYLLFAVVGPVVVSFIAQRSRNLVRNVILGSLAAVVLIYADQAAGENRRARFLDLQEVQELRYWNTVGAASAFAPVDISTPGRALVFLPEGFVLFLLAPFPWMVGSIRQILAVPETLFFYWLIPHMLRGIRQLLRHHAATSLMALMVTAGLTLGYALGEGNAGTAYRHRAQLLSFFLIFAAVGIESRRHSPVPDAVQPMLSPAR